MKDRRQAIDEKEIKTPRVIIKNTNTAKRILLALKLHESGITVEQMADRKRSFKDNLLKCLWNGLIIFLFTTGLTAMFSASFDMPCSYPVLILVCAAASFAFALLYVNTAVYNAGYLFLMVVVIASIIRLYVVINSGYNAVLNILTEAVKEEMHLPYLRQHMEIYGNRQVTVTVFLALTGSVLAMFFNMWVSRRKSVAAPLVVIFPVLEICIYLRDDFSYVGFAILLLAVCLFIITVQNDPVPMDKKKNQKTWRIRKRRSSHKGKDPDGKDCAVIVLDQEKPERKGGAAAAVVFVAGTLLVSTLFFGLLSRRFVNTDSPLKKSSDRIVKTVAMHGIEGLFMRNSSQGRGGMSDGSFGDVSSVYLDYETDLEITLVPYTELPVYLPTYTGAVYDGQERRWSNVSIKEDTPVYQNLPSYETAGAGYPDTYRLMDEIAKNGEWDRYKVLNVNMLIKNVGVYPVYSLYGYTGFEDDHRSGPSFSAYYSEGAETVFWAQEDDDHTKLSYYACLLDYNEYKKLAASGGKPSGVQGAYTEVPEDIREELEKICGDAGFGGSAAQIIRQLQQYLADGYQYTVSPGRTPSNRDFVLYFLREKKQGFCVHFASSACLLLRTMGIPARYAEGYCFDYTVYEDALPYEGEQTEWNTGYSGLDYHQPVTIELSDGNAHAWVEVYFEEIGWVPVEFTVGTVADGDAPGIMEFLSDIFGFGGGINTEPDDGQNFFTDAGAAIQNWFESRFAEALWILLGAAAGVFLLKYIIYLFRAYASRADDRAVFQYRTLARRARRRLSRKYRGRRGDYRKLVISYDVMRAILTDEYGIDAAYADHAMSAYERYNYSGRDADRNIRELTRIYRRLVGAVTWKRLRGSA